MKIIAKKTVDNSKAYKKPMPKVQAPDLARRNKKRTSRTSIKAPSIPSNIGKLAMPTISLTEPDQDVGGIQRPEEEEAKNHLKQVKCDQFTCFINTNGTEAHIRHNSNNEEKIDDNGETVTVSFNSDDWLFSQTTALASVDIIEGFKISPKTSKFVNNNGNAFSDRIVQKYYKTFIGAHNYRNHIQDPDESYGIVIDAVLRAVPLSEDNNDIVYYVDTLIATNRNKDKAWAKAIENGVVKFVSMGAESSSFRCTYCGNIPTTYDEFCDHFKYSKGKYYIDEKGRKMRIAHLVEDYKNRQGSGYVEFVELSYLDVNPAFAGASQSHIIKVPANTDINISLPVGYLSKSAFQVWKDHYRVH